MELPAPLALSFLAEIDVYDLPRADLTPLRMIAWKRVGSRVFQQPYFYWGRSRVVPSEINKK
jgi:hypothetical protein